MRVIIVGSVWLAISSYDSALFTVIISYKPFRHKHFSYANVGNIVEKCNKAYLFAIKLFYMCKFKKLWHLGAAKHVV